jgi:glutamate formiminotransferase/formiminotetrahydrofolate cyclodeaminase
MRSRPIIECVPNFSEGRDLDIIRRITDEIEKVEGVRLLDVDPGKATNRTVVTFVGYPEAVVEAAFAAIRKAAELIDMRQHQGEHPRMGATDVCPLIPVSQISMEGVAKYAHMLAKRVGEELDIPVFTYEAAATRPERKNLATIRSGEYEGFERKLADPEWKPDYGRAVFNAKSGATVIGARDFLIAYNVNLNTTSVRKANSVAFDIRENGRVKTDENGKPVTDLSGQAVRIPGVCKAVKAIGWYIEEYGIAQVSMNLTDIGQTSLHEAFQASCDSAERRGMRVTGSELVGLVPKKVLLDAGRYFLQKQRRSVGVDEESLIHMAVKSMGLDALGPFDPQKKVIEYLLAEESDRRLISMTLQAFANETASESPAPGGGSISAYAGALGVSLATMVANLSAHKKGWEEKINYFSDIAEKGQKIKDELLKLVDADTRAFNRIMDAFRLAKATDVEKAFRKQAIHDATAYAINVPLEVMKMASEAMDLALEMVEKGNPNSVTDAAVGGLCARTAAEGAFLNIKINCKGFDDLGFVERVVEEGGQILQKLKVKEAQILSLTEKTIQG